MSETKPARDTVKAPAKRTRLNIPGFNGWRVACDGPQGCGWRGTRFSNTTGKPCPQCGGTVSLA